MLYESWLEMWCCTDSSHSKSGDRNGPDTSHNPSVKKIDLKSRTKRLDQINFIILLPLPLVHLCQHYWRHCSGNSTCNSRPFFFLFLRGSDSLPPEVNCPFLLLFLGCLTSHKQLDSHCFPLLHPQCNALGSTHSRIYWELGDDSWYAFWRLKIHHTDLQ